MPDRPKLVIVGGAPGSGKTTLAVALASRLALALLAKDDIKEALGDVLGTRDPVWSRQLGAATYAVMEAVAARSLAVGAGLIVEANFTRERSEHWLRGLAERADARVVLCRTPRDRDRFVARSGTRHSIHPDDVGAEWSPAEDFAIDLGVPRLDVDTTSGYVPDLESIVRFIR